MADPTPPQIPEELKLKKETQDLAAQKAQDQINSEVKKGEAFMSGIGYISFLCILPLVLLRDSKFAQFHGKQALVLAIFIYFLDIIQIFPARFAFIYLVLKISIVMYSVFMAARGKYFKLPFIYDISEKFSINISEEPSKSTPTNI